MLVAVFAALLASSPSSSDVVSLKQAPLPEVSRYARVYRGPEGIRAVVVRVGALSERQVLLRVSGLEHELDSVVLRCEVSETAGQAEIWSSLGGKRFVALRGVPDEEGALQWELELPGMKRAVRVRYDEGESRLASGQRLLEEHLAQTGARPSPSSKDRIGSKKKAGVAQARAGRR